MLTPSETRAVLAELVDAALHGTSTDWATGTQRLLASDGRSWLALDDTARKYSPYDERSVLVSGTRGWLSSNIDEPTGFVAVITSMHADGRIRQRATQVLAHHSGLVVTAALALRCLDHVPQVRDDAIAALERRVGDATTEWALAVLLAGQGRLHAAVALHAFLQAFEASEDSTALVWQLTSSTDRRVRRWAYERAHKQDLLSAAQLTALAAGETDQFLRAEAARWLGAVVTQAQLGELLRARFVDGRLLALAKLDDEQLSTETILAMLVDPSARVQEVAQWRARRRGVDVAAVYRSLLGNDEHGTPPVTAGIDALATLGSGPSDLALVRPYLNDPRPRVRSAAVSGVGVLADRLQARDLLRPLLLDPSPRVCAAAARALARAGWAEGEAAEAWASAQPWSRRAGWRLSRAAGGWERVAADARAAADDDDVLRGLGRAGLHTWLNGAAATTWGTPSTHQMLLLEDTLPRTGLPEWARRQIAFHAGLAAPATPLPSPPIAPVPAKTRRWFSRRP